MDLDVVDVGDGECLRSGAQHHGATHPLRFNYRSARSMIPTSVSLRTETKMGSSAMAVHSPNLLPVPARFNYRSARSTITTSVSLRIESNMGSPAMAVHSPILLPIPARADARERRVGLHH